MSYFNTLIQRGGAKPRDEYEDVIENAKPTLKQIKKNKEKYEAYTAKIKNLFKTFPKFEIYDVDTFKSALKQFEELYKNAEDALDNTNNAIMELSNDTRLKESDIPKEIDSVELEELMQKYYEQRFIYEDGMKQRKKYTKILDDIADLRNKYEKSYEALVEFYMKKIAPVTFDTKTIPQLMETKDEFADFIDKSRELFNSYNSKIEEISKTDINKKYIPPLISPKEMNNAIERFNQLNEFGLELKEDLDKELKKTATEELQTNEDTNRTSAAGYAEPLTKEQEMALENAERVVNKFQNKLDKKQRVLDETIQNAKKFQDKYLKLSNYNIRNIDLLVDVLNEFAALIRIAQTAFMDFEDVIELINLEIQKIPDVPQQAFLKPADATFVEKLEKVFEGFRDRLQQLVTERERVGRRRDRDDREGRSPDRRDLTDSEREERRRDRESRARERGRDTDSSDARAAGAGRVSSSMFPYIHNNSMPVSKLMF